MTAVTEKPQAGANLPEETAHLKARAESALTAARVPEALLRQVEELSGRVRNRLRAGAGSSAPENAEWSCSRWVLMRSSSAARSKMRPN